MEKRLVKNKSKLKLKQYLKNNKEKINVYIKQLSLASRDLCKES